MGPPAPLHRPVMPLLLLLIPPVLLASMAGGCMEEERQALLEFKRGLVDRNNVLASWNSSSTQGCCSWFGITCTTTNNNKSSGGGGHVIGLNLFGAGLSGTISPSLLALKHLKVLDLSLNEFQGISVPPFLGSLRKLTSLRLRRVVFRGAIPPELGMLRNLQELDLSESEFQGIPIPPFIGSYQNLTSLKLGFCGFRGLIPPQLGMLTNLRYLSIVELYLYRYTKTLSYYQLYVENSRWMSNLSSLETLKFQNVDLGRASHLALSLSRLTSLHSLVLPFCNITFPGDNNLSSFQDGFASLRELDLSHNKIGKSMLPWIGSLKNLERLILDDCRLDGVVTEHHLRNLASLSRLQLSNNLLHVQINPDWAPSFSLTYLDLTSCQIGPLFPQWIRTQKNIVTLTLASAGMADSLPKWIWDFSSSLSQVDLSSNNLRGQLPGRINPSIKYLSLSFNSFSGSLSHFVCNSWPLNNTLVLDLEHNLLSGNMSDCWDQWRSLRTLSISSNNLTGQFPESFANLRELRALHLRNNSLSGNLPLAVHDWTNVMTIDLSKNKLDGSIESYYWGKLSNLKILILDSNKFSGIVPLDFCNLKSLQIMSLASNDLSGAIPSCFNKLTGLAVKQDRPEVIAYETEQENLERIALLLKGRIYEYSNTLGLVRLMDISNNHLSGDIPKELMDLEGLQFLNLSGNQLTGRLPMTIRDMSSLESLDLSRNKFSGEIPSTISHLTLLSHLNVSYNRLTGRIPSGPQLDTSNPSSFIGNALCGKPLQEKCGSSDVPNAKHSEDYKEEDDDDSLIAFYIALPIGFGAGSSAVFITLLFRRSWRIAYFRWTEKMMDKLS